MLRLNASKRDSCSKKLLNIDDMRPHNPEKYAFTTGAQFLVITTFGGS
jgi:hypothetical protein